MPVPEGDVQRRAQPGAVQDPLRREVKVQRDVRRLGLVRGQQVEAHLDRGPRDRIGSSTSGKETGEWITCVASDAYTPFITLAL